MGICKQQTDLLSLFFEPSFFFDKDLLQIKGTKLCEWDDNLWGKVNKKTNLYIEVFTTRERKAKTLSSS